MPADLYFPGIIMQLSDLWWHFCSDLMTSFGRPTILRRLISIQYSSGQMLSLSLGLPWLYTCSYPTLLLFLIGQPCLYFCSFYSVIIAWQKVVQPLFLFICPVFVYHWTVFFCECSIFYSFLLCTAKIWKSISSLRVYFIIFKII